jgi:hypothetical protein
MHLSLAPISAGLRSPPLTTRPFYAALALLLAADFAFIVAHLLWSFQVVLSPFGAPISFGANRWLNIGQERGYAEVWECLVASSAVVLFLACYVRRRQAAYLGLAALFFLVAGDNLLQFHERAGVLVAQALGQGELSLTRHAGELAALLVMGGAAAGIFLVTYRMSDAAARRSALVGLGIVGALAFFAVGVDVAHALVSAAVALPRAADDAFTLVEDGGETMAISLGLAFAWASFRALPTRRRIGAV